MGVCRVGRVRGCGVWVRRARRAGIIRKEYVDLGVGVVRCESSDILGKWKTGMRQEMVGKRVRGRVTYKGVREK